MDSVFIMIDYALFDCYKRVATTTLVIGGFFILPLGEKMPILIILFFLLSIVNLAAEFYSYVPLVYITKPLLVSTLVLWFFRQTKSKRSKSERLIILGLIFSILGDTLLMFVEHGNGGDLLFALGLGSFLFTHIFYTLAFNAYRSIKNGFLNQYKWWILPFFLYLFINTFFLYPDTPTDLQIPVIIYSCAITMMAISALNLRGYFPAIGFPLLMIAVLLFVLSDTIIGWNKFKTATVTIPQPRLLIMIPYLLSQYLLVTVWARFRKK